MTPAPPSSSMVAINITSGKEENNQTALLEFSPLSPNGLLIFIIFTFGRQDEKIDRLYSLFM